VLATSQKSGVLALRLQAAGTELDFHEELASCAVVTFQLEKSTFVPFLGAGMTNAAVVEFDPA